MPDIDPDFLCHHLSMDAMVRPVRQRRRKFNEERRLVIREVFRPVDRDVFVRDLNRQLGSPSHWLPVESCKKEDKEAP